MTDKKKNPGKPRSTQASGDQPVTSPPKRGEGRSESNSLHGSPSQPGRKNYGSDSDGTATRGSSNTGLNNPMGNPGTPRSHIPHEPNTHDPRRASSSTPDSQSQTDDSLYGSRNKDRNE